MSETTIFKRIIDGEIPADKVYEDESVPGVSRYPATGSDACPGHPKQEIASIADLRDEDQALMGHLWRVIRDVARQLGLDNGYRVVVNCGETADKTCRICTFICSAAAA